MKKVSLATAVGSALFACFALAQTPATGPK